MPIYTTGPIGAPSQLTDLSSPFGESAGAALDEALAGNPTRVIYDFTRYTRANDGVKLDEADASKRIKDAGVPLTVPKGGITAEALDLLIDRKRDEISRQSVLSRAAPGVLPSSARFLVGMAGSMIDPINVASAFIPIVGEARYAEMVANASSAWARAGVRAGIGSAEGALGAAVVEPISLYGRTQMQDDYHMTDSLLNVAFGAGLGGTLHAGGGSVADALGISRFARESQQRQMDDIRAELIRVEAARPDEPVSIPEFAQKQIDAVAVARAEIDGQVRTDAQIGEALANRTANFRLAEREYSRIPGTDGGRILNTDEARELSPEYRADRTRSAAVHEPASAFVKRLYEEKLARPTPDGQVPVVLFTAGGTGAGKSTALRAMGEAAQRAEMIYDTNMNTLASAQKKIDQALKAGRDVRVLYVYRDPVEALTGGALPRAMRMGRTVPIKEHGRTHAGASATVRELAQIYKDDPRVSISVFDNSRGPQGGGPASLADIPEVSYNEIERRLQDALEREHADGRISEAVYRGTRGPEVQPDARAAGADGEAPAGIRGEPSQGHPDGSAGQSGPLTPAADIASAMSLEGRQAAARAAVGQAMAGRIPDVESVARADFAAGTSDAPAALADARAAGERLSSPESVAVADFPASAAADARLAAADASDTAAQNALAVTTQRLDTMLSNLEARGFSPERIAAARAELKPFDDAIADSKRLGDAMKAAAVCGIK